MKIKEYIEYKLKVLKELHITLTDDEMKELESFTDDLSVDVFIRRVIAKRWNIEQ